MKVVLACPSVVENDAVGHDVIEQYNCLKEEGFDVFLYADNYEVRFEKLVLRKSLDFLGHDKTILIYHHAEHWEKGLNLLKSSRGKKIIKYHNITPERYFKPYSFHFSDLCSLGRKQNSEIAKLDIDMLLSDSSFNASDFLNIGFPKDRIRILAPFNKIHEFDKVTADSGVLQKLNDGNINVFFVSRIAPNKGHRHILLTASFYEQLFDSKIRFIMAGGLDPKLKGYSEELLALVRQLGLDEIVKFVGRVSASELKAFYLSSDVFLLLSEHEGFCVPVLEAQYFRTPIVAYGSSAIKETIGENQLVYDKIDYGLIASSINTIHNNVVAKKQLTQAGYKNFLKYENELLKSKFLSCVRELC